MKKENKIDVIARLGQSKQVRNVEVADKGREKKDSLFG